MIRELLSNEYARVIIIGICLGGILGCINLAFNNAKGGK